MNKTFNELKDFVVSCDCGWSDIRQYSQQQVDHNRLFCICPVCLQKISDKKRFEEWNYRNDARKMSSL